LVFPERPFELESGRLKNPINPQVKYITNKTKAPIKIHELLKTQLLKEL